MIKDLFNEVVNDALYMVQKSSPYKTGTLSQSFYLVEYEDGFGIRTDLDYMQYTEEPWTYNSRWGKTLLNPNERWFTEVALLIAEMLAIRLGGVVSVEY